ncbi:hypothetical protein BDV93DRAFT_262192 [Ceratobasidium sp. AG-I]|nr:hypothetical protein BDV93DRAFT_262192 [Ceratobasidium sp. AG-I]
MDKMPVPRMYTAFSPCARYARTSRVSEVTTHEPIHWSAVDRALRKFPPTVENLLCMDQLDAYAVQRSPM